MMGSAWIGVYNNWNTTEVKLCLCVVCVCARVRVFTPLENVDKPQEQIGTSENGK